MTHRYEQHLLHRIEHYAELVGSISFWADAPTDPTIRPPVTTDRALAEIRTLLDAHRASTTPDSGGDPGE